MSKPTYEEFIQMLSEAAEHEANLGNAEKSQAIRYLLDLTRELNEGETANAN